VEYAVGVDLHGTLIEDGEYVRSELLEGLKAAFRGLGDSFRLFVCTGNDLPFVARKVPEDVLGFFDGLVLEHGCVLSDGVGEEVIVGEETVQAVKEMEEGLRSGGLPPMLRAGRMKNFRFRNYLFSATKPLRRVSSRASRHSLAAERL